MMLLLLHLLLMVMVATAVVGRPLVRDVTPVVDWLVRRRCSRVSVSWLLLMLLLVMLLLLLMVVLG